MKLIKCIYNSIDLLSQRAREDSVNATAGHATLFILISFFPFVMLLLASVKYMPFSREQVVELFDFISPGALSETIRIAIYDVYARSGSVALSISALSLLWSASTSIYSITIGLNRVYNFTETRNYWHLRIVSLFHTFIFIISIAVSLTLMVFGRSIINFLAGLSPFFSRFDTLLNLSRSFIAFLLLLFIFNLLYTIIPNRPSRLDFEFIGAAFSAVGWYLFSYFYSLYIEYFSNVSYIYGSIAAVVLLLIWLYTCLYIFFLGAEINQIAAEKGWRKAEREKFLKKHSAKKESEGK